MGALHVSNSEIPVSVHPHKDICRLNLNMFQQPIESTFSNIREIPCQAGFRRFGGSLLVPPKLSANRCQTLPRKLLKSLRNGPDLFRGEGGQFLLQCWTRFPLRHGP